MLELSQQVISKDLAVKLKEAGVEQKSLFYWINFEKYPGNPNWALENIAIEELKKQNFEMLSAFSASELAEILKTDLRISIDMAGDGFRVLLGADDFYHKNLAEALGNCLLFMKTNKLV